jgi:RimJ/RimL family protein N-acetyltransferase
MSGSPSQPSPLAWPAGPLVDGPVRLDLLARDDARAVADAVDDEVLRWLPLPSPYTVDDAREFIGGAHDAAAGGEGVHLAIRVDGAFAGIVGAHVARCRPGETEIGYWVAAGFRARGVAARAIRLCARHAFAGWAPRRIELLIQVGNDGSRRAAVRAGAVHEGVRRHGISFAAAGEARDAHVYSLLPEDVGLG